MKTAFIVARILSVIFVCVTLCIIFISAIEVDSNMNPNSIPQNTIIQLFLFGVGLLGLLVAWKWIIAGGIISLLAFVALFLVNMDVVLWIMIIFPINSIIFITIGVKSKYFQINNLSNL